MNEYSKFIIVAKEKKTENVEGKIQLLNRQDEKISSKI